MKRTWIKFIILALISSTLLVACSGKEDNSEVVSGGNSITEKDNSNDELAEEVSFDKDRETNTVSSTSTIGDLPDDQLGLAIGDTAIVKSNFSEHEITLNSVEIKEQVDDTASELGNFVIVNLTVLNTGDEAVAAADIFSSTDLSSIDNSSGFPWYYIEGVAEEWPVDINPGESQTGVLLFDMEVSDQYILTDGEFLEGLTNKISFEFTREEAN
ncbi:DUF4352 domain-containing protein [Oceanobacillus chungangensis]|uniref:DUF4352 domain-containing protein n=1 Tax=Oceanobacillus chungangensis TaxID=1229152 RepID=A0A3D8Q293_9BACI|nr:DUF4352 domain-containing protein [Oceanobacillus chungangensis]RDW21721.1 hypothetical protein CWR45_02280 [Oceanobacillus chungangensis]